MTAHVNAVQKNCHVGKFPVSIHLLHIRKLPSVHSAGTDDKNCKIRYPVDNGSISDNAGRDTVNDNIVISFPELAEQVIEPAVHKEFGRIRSRSPGKDDVRSV